MLDLKDKILAVLQLLSIFFGRLPKIGPVIQLLILFITTFWDQIEPLFKKLPATAYYGIRDTRQLMGGKSSDDSMAVLVREIQNIATEGAGD